MPAKSLLAKLAPIGRSKSGRAGGKATAAKHGSEFYKKIGRLGGKSRGKKKTKKHQAELVLTTA